jgi:hypothetical protein
MSCIIDGSAGITTPGVVNTAGETIATTLVVSGAISGAAGSFTTLSANGDITFVGASRALRNAGTFTMINDLGSNGVNIGNAGAGATLKFQTAVGDAAAITAAGLLQFNSGYGSVATAYGCRAWVNFNGTTVTPSTIRGSGNVSSVTKNATGTYTVNFTTAMVDANYSVITACSTNNAYNNDGIGFALNIAMNVSTPIQYSTAGVRVSGGLGNGAPSEGGTNYSQVAVFR